MEDCIWLKTNIWCVERWGWFKLPGIIPQCDIYKDDFFPKMLFSQGLKKAKAGQSLCWLNLNLCWLIEVNWTKIAATLYRKIERKKSFKGSMQTLHRPLLSINIIQGILLFWIELLTLKKTLSVRRTHVNLAIYCHLILLMVTVSGRRSSRPRKAWILLSLKGLTPFAIWNINKINPQTIFLLNLSWVILVNDSKDSIEAQWFFSPTFSSPNKGGFTTGADWIISVCIGGSRPKDVQCLPVLISTRTVWMNGLCLFSTEEDLQLQKRLSQASLKDAKEKKHRVMSAGLTKTCVKVDSLYHLPQHPKQRRRGVEKRPPVRASVDGGRQGDRQQAEKRDGEGSYRRLQVLRNK